MDLQFNIGQWNKATRPERKLTLRAAHLDEQAASVWSGRLWEQLSKEVQDKLIVLWQQHFDY